MDEGIVEGAADETLEGADGVPEVGGLLGLCRLANSTLPGAKGNERAGRGEHRDKKGEEGHTRSRSVGDLVGDDVDAATAGHADLCWWSSVHGRQTTGTDLAVESAKVNANDGHWRQRAQAAYK